MNTFGAGWNWSCKWGGIHENTNHNYEIKIWTSIKSHYLTNWSLIMSWKYSPCKVTSISIANAFAQTHISWVDCNLGISFSRSFCWLIELNWYAFICYLSSPVQLMNVHFMNSYDSYNSWLWAVIPHRQHIQLKHVLCDYTSNLRSPVITMIINQLNIFSCVHLSYSLETSLPEWKKSQYEFEQIRRFSLASD